MLKLLLSLSLFVVASLQVSANPFPVKIDADALFFEQDKKEVRFTGQVKVTHQGMYLTAQELIASYENQADDIQEVYAIGDVKVVKGNDVVKGDKATYNINNQILLLEGNVDYKRDGTLLKGEKLEFNIATGKAQLMGEDVNRVRAEFSAGAIKGR